MRENLLHGFLETSARNFPDKVAVIQDERRVTYRQINGWANDLSRRFHRCGVMAGDRVVLYLENSIEYVVGYFAALKTGAIAVPLCSELPWTMVARLMEKVTPAAFVTSGRSGRVLAQPDVRMSAPVMVGHQCPPCHSGAFVGWEEVFREEDSDDPRHVIGNGALASIIHTSGSTGTPKGVMLSHRNLVANAHSIVQYLRLTENDIQMVVLPFYYVMGKSLLTTHFAVGGTVVINNRFAFPSEVVSQMIREKVTGFSGVPSTYTYLLHRSQLAACRDSLSSLRYCSQAGGHLPRRTKEEIIRMLPDHTLFYVMYGATEASARLSYVDPEWLPEKMDSIGQPIPGVTLSVRGEDGRELPDGEIGEIVASGQNIMQGYWQDEEATAKVLDELGYHTGDLGYRDGDGFFYVVGRRDNILKIGGHRINPVEVEEALMGTDLLVEVAVLGVKDNLLEPRLVALAAPRTSSCSETELLRRCVTVLPKYKMPSVVKLVGALPKTPQGKVDNRKCHELAVSCIQQVSLTASPTSTG